MDKSSIRKEAKLYFLPFILGNNKNAHKLSKKIYRRYGIVCFILDKKRVLSDIFDFSSRFLPITDTKNDELTVKEIIYLANQEQYTLPILVPCSKEYRELVEKNRELLEAIFVLSNEDTVINTSPLNIIPR